MHPHKWCIVTSDDRPREPLTAYWALHAAINEVYCTYHDYGFVYVQLAGGVNGSCGYTLQYIYNEPRPGHAATSVWRKRSSTWCKIPAVAHVLLHGTREKRACGNVLYVDSDAHVSNLTMSIDDYLERARRRGDEAVQTHDWEMLFSSNYWFEPDSINSGVWFVRSGPEACGLLRFWWSHTFFPHFDIRLPYEIGLDQEVMRLHSSYLLIISSSSSTTPLHLTSTSPHPRPHLLPYSLPHPTLSFTCNMYMCM